MAKAEASADRSEPQWMKQEELEEVRVSRHVGLPPGTLV